MKTEFAQQQIADFRNRFGESHLYFAYHAAFPLALTPDLSYRLWANFQRDKDGKLLQSRANRILQIPWIAVADLLLSGLCKEVAHELYEIDPAIRQELLKRLGQDERFGKARIHELATFIEHYYEQQLQSDDLHLRNFATTQQWMVTAYRNPQSIAQELAEKLAESVAQENKADALRLSLSIESLAQPLQEAGLEAFVNYAQFINHWGRGRKKEARYYRAQLPKGSQSLVVANTTLPIPPKEVEKTRQRQTKPIENWRTVCLNCMSETEGKDLCPECGTPLHFKNEDEETLRPRTRLFNGLYLIGTCLEIDKFSITYLGLNLKLKEHVSIKEFFPKKFAARAQDQVRIIIPHSKENHEDYQYALSKFIQEANTLASFNHRNIVPILSSFEENNTAYVIMRYIKGETLEARVKELQGNVSEKEMLQIMKGVLEGLQVIHEANILHRDIQPRHIYLSNEGNAILTDFGAARQSMRNQTETIFNTGYIPIEQYPSSETANLRIGPWSDVYACAATMYSCLKGEFDRYDHLVPPLNVIDRINAYKQAPLDPVQQVSNTALSPHVATAIMEGLKIPSEERPQSAFEFLAMLEGNYPEKEKEEEEEEQTVFFSEKIGLLPQKNKHVNDVFFNVCCNCMRPTEGKDPCPNCGSPLIFQNKPDELPPRFILNEGRYLIGKTLGRGIFGITYLGLDINLQRPVAIKEFLPQHIAKRATDRKLVIPVHEKDSKEYQHGIDRFVEESRLLAKFLHPNIVSITYYFEENNTAYMVMKYDTGKDLQEYVQIFPNGITEQGLLKVMLPILEGLKKVHSSGLIHRNIKPTSIYLPDNGAPLLLSFGCASRFPQKEYEVILTHGYSPYEQYSATSQQGPYTDIYACAATMYACLRGYNMKKGHIIPPPSAQERRNGSPLPHIKDASQQKISLHLANAIMRGLELEPKNRPQTIDEFLNDIVRYSISSPRQIEFELLALSGEFKDQTIPLSSKPIIIGRSSKKCDLILTERDVSDVHCQIHTEDGIVYVKDLNSTGGTQVNGKQIQKAAVRPGDTISLAGQVTFQIVEAQNHQKNEQKKELEEENPETESGGLLARAFKRFRRSK